MKLFWAIFKKEFKQILRDSRTLAMIIFTPALLLILFGYVLSFDVRNIKTVVFDNDKTYYSREFLRRLKASNIFEITKMIENESLIFNELDSFKSEVAILIPNGFGEKIAKSSVPQLGIFIDGTNAQIATIVQGYIRAISEFQSLKILSGYFSAPQIKAQPRIWYNPELRSNVFLIPGLIVFILMITCTISTALSIVRERERGTMEQLLISPLSGAHIILGKTLPYVFIALVSLSLVLVTSSFVFNINVKGSYGLLFLSSILFIVCACGQGIFISSVTRSQQVAYFASALSSILPSLILSGFIFPIRNMPYAIQILTYIVPARYFVALLRSIMIKGVHFNIFWKEMLALFLFSLFILLGAIMRMKKAKMT